MQDIKSNFKNQDLYDLAMTHRSWVNENPENTGTNERLEFLGDAILEFVVSQYIYNKLPDKEEGFLTALRANIVNTKSLSEAASEIELGDFLRLSKGEESGGGRKNPALLANAFEALIGAIYLDRGLDAAKEFIYKNLLKDFEEKLKNPLKDPKSRLQETVQAQGKPAPTYRVISEEGPDHNKTFEVSVYIDGQQKATATGSSKLRAEQAAAKAALAKISTNK